MTDDPRVQQLLDQLHDSQATPEEVCRSYPELLPVVRNHWRRMPDDQQVCVDGSGTERQRGRLRLQFHWMHAIFILPAELRLNSIPRRPGTAAPGADIYSVACQAREILNMGIGSGYYGDQLRIKRQHRPQAAERSVGPPVLAIVGGKLNIGLDYAELQFAGTERF